VVYPDGSLAVLLLLTWTVAAFGEAAGVLGNAGRDAGRGASWTTVNSGCHVWPAC